MPQRQRATTQRKAFFMASTTVAIFVVCFLAICSTGSIRKKQEEEQWLAMIGKRLPRTSSSSAQQQPPFTFQGRSDDNHPTSQAASHFCHSRDLLPDNGKRATCLFRNLCVKKSVQPPLDGIQNNQNASLSDKHEVEFYYPFDNHKPHSHSFSLGVGPHSVDDRLYFEPVDVPFEEWQQQHPSTTFVSGLSLIYYDYNSGNFGHMLTDVLLPMYAALESLGLYMEELPQLNVLRYSIQNAIGYSCDYMTTTWQHPDPNQTESFRRATARQCRRFQRMMGSMLPGSGGQERDIQVLSRKTLPSEEPLCFERLVVGMPMYSDDCLDGWHGRRHDEWFTCLHGRQEQLWRFRGFIFKSVLGAAPAPPQQHKIVVTLRGAGLTDRRLPNLNELIETLRQAYANTGVDIVTVQWHTLSWKQQLEMISDATLLITPPGAVSFMALFLPRWATQVRLHSSEPHLEWHLFNYVGYTHADFVDCSLDDAGIPIDHVVGLVHKALQRYETFALGPGVNQGQG